MAAAFAGRLAEPPAMNRRAFVLATAAAAYAPRAAIAQTVTPAFAIARLFTAPPIQAAWFTPVFLAAVNVTQIQTIVASLIDTLGPYQSIAPNGTGYTVTFARGSVQADATVDAGGAFNSLTFGRMQSPIAADRASGVFQTVPIPAAWFSDRIVATGGVEKVRTAITAFLTQYGAFKQAAPAPDGTYTVTFANGTATLLIFLGPDQKIESIYLQPH
jgi:hypothetical protein